MHPSSTIDLGAKVLYLLRPDAYSDRPDAVEAIETHFAWVFLSRRYAYKLKKPVRFEELDLTTLEARRADCELEVALNRRLAEGVYIGVVALGREDTRLRLECDADPVDWLVKMHRLPREQMLDALLPGIALEDSRLERFLERLCRFYERTPRAPWTGAQYLDFLRRQIKRYGAELATPELGLDHAPVSQIVAMQLDFIERRQSLLEARIAEGRVVDAHGDLRPEHIWLADPPQVIDCLEFSARLRLLDTAEELAFLALQCERLGRPDLGRHLRERYAEHCRDEIADCLFSYYRSQRALVSALLSAWHLREHLEPRAAERWLARARWYVEIARSSIEHAGSRNAMARNGA